MANVLNKTNFKYLESVNTPDYPESEWIINPDLSGVDGVPKKYWKIENNSVVEMSQAEKDLVDLEDLDSYKTQKILQIDAKTRELISHGFEFDGHTFSLSLNAQSNFMGIKVATDGGLLTESDYPYELTTLDDNAYQLSWSNKETFFGLVLNSVSTLLKGGRDLKVQVKNATNKSEVDAVVDNR